LAGIIIATLFQGDFYEKKLCCFPDGGNPDFLWRGFGFRTIAEPLDSAEIQSARIRR
jgi:hypothetical protein